MSDMAPSILSKCNTDLSPMMADSQTKATEVLARQGDEVDSGQSGEHGDKW
jgi:hypothetical protein